VSDYDSNDDVTKCFEASYLAIRERMAAGGPGWTPKMTYDAAFPRAPSEGGAAERGTGRVKDARSHPSLGRASTGSKCKLPLINLELTENEIQKSIFEHLRTRGAPGIFAFHPKNSSADMTGRKAGIHVGLGVEPGIPDVIVIRDALTLGESCVYALELKRESRRGKKLTKHEEKQLQTRQRMSFCGITIGVAYGLDEAIAWLESHALLIGRAA